jgi:hypothetical protein
MNQHFKSYNDFIDESIAFPQEKPNEFAYLHYKKWAYENRENLKKDFNKAGSNITKMWDTVTSWWMRWVKDSNNKPWGYITDNQKFGRELARMMKSDNLIFDKKGNKITKLL